MMPTPTAATAADAAALAEELGRARVLPADRLAGLMADFPGGGPATLAEFLVSRRALTRFQAERALSGETRLLTPGPYILTGVHGPGTLGTVFRAVHRAKPGDFVVKLLPLRSLWQARQAKQLVRNLTALPRHPALVPLADADSANGFHYLVWPLTDCETLADRTRISGPLSYTETVDLLSRVADVLAMCHHRQIVHGALTPLSVGLAPDGSPRLLEFGAGELLARNLAAEESLFDTMSSALAVAGLLDYAAPEFLADPADPRPAADQYALGAVGYFALTGRPPFPAGSAADRVRARRDPPTPPHEANPDVPLELAAVIDQLLAFDPAARFSGMDEVREQLAEVARLIDPGRVQSSSAEHDPDRPEEFTGSVGGRTGSDQVQGAIAWGTGGSGPVRPPVRDDTEASVGFDLPEPEPEPEPPPRPRELRPADTPPLAAAETREARPRPAPEPPRRTPLTPPPALPVPSPPPRPTPGMALPTPVQWHTAEPDAAGESGAIGSADDGGSPGVVWKRVRRNLLFWKAAADTVQVSVFAPAGLTPGRTAQLVVYAHHPDAAESVGTLARAFYQGAELVGTGRLVEDVARGSELAVHLAVANAGVGTSLVRFPWRGQPHRLVFDLHVPWESPGGPAPGLLSIGRNDVRIGKVEFRLQVLPRRS